MRGSKKFASGGEVVMGVMGLGRRGKRGGLTGMRDHLHMSTSVIALEPRFMFDAAGVATAVDSAVPDTGRTRCSIPPAKWWIRRFWTRRRRRAYRNPGGSCR